MESLAFNNAVNPIAAAGGIDTVVGAMGAHRKVADVQKAPAAPSMSRDTVQTVARNTLESGPRERTHSPRSVLHRTVVVYYCRTCARVNGKFQRILFRCFYWGVFCSHPKLHL